MGWYAILYQKKRQNKQTNAFVPYKERENSEIQSTIEMTSTCRKNVFNFLMVFHWSLVQLEDLSYHPHVIIVTYLFRVT